MDALDLIPFAYVVVLFALAIVAMLRLVKTGGHASVKNIAGKNFCNSCGRRIRKQYTHCYRCFRARKRANWHEPESLPELESRDAQLGRTVFYVYVVDTDFGQYVGHSGNIVPRLNAHMRGEVSSTAGGNPKMVWCSQPCATRKQAARFEAALKSLRDNRRNRFAEITGVTPRPWRR